MAKRKPSLTGLFEKTETQGEGQRDIVEAHGVGLKKSEWAEMEQIAGELGITLHAVTAYGVRYFLKAYREGKIKPETQKTQSLPKL
jgi:hypothetical protein